MKTIKVITTVGVSLIQNANNPKKGGDGVDYYDDLKVCSYYEMHEHSSTKKKISRAKASIQKFIDKKNGSSISAEIKSLVLIQAQEKCKLEVYLICTDTILSVVAADMIKEFFEGNIEKNIKGYDPEKTNFEIRFEHNEEFIMANDTPSFIKCTCNIFNVTGGDKQWAVQCALKNANTVCLSERQMTAFVETSYGATGCWDGWYDWS